MTPVDTVVYSYSDTLGWGDLLTAYDGQTFVYDGVGNPLTQTDANGNTVRSFQWKHGRQLAAMTVGGQTWSFTYNADGLRTSKTNGAATYQYIYDGSKLTQMVYGDHVLYFSYDATGAPLTLTHNGTLYYYVTNIQGDVIAITDDAGFTVVTYGYDAWGNLLSTGGSLANTLGILNPLRYRGYVYDQETSLYYLQSRYYDPQLSRFLNVDAFVSTGHGFAGNNMLAYCNNNPTNYTDSLGSSPDWHPWDAAMEFLAGWITGRDVYSQQHQLENQIIAEQMKLLKPVSSVCNLIVDNVEISAGVGQGLYVEVDVLDIASLQAGMYGNYASVIIEDGETLFGQELNNDISISVFGHSFGTNDYTFMKDGMTINHESNSGVYTDDSWTLFSVAFYPLAGFSFRLGFDIIQFCDSWNELF